MNDRARFDQKAEAERETLTHCIRRLMGTKLKAHESATDLVQSVFRTMWRNRSTLPDGDVAFAKRARLEAHRKAADRGRYYNVDARKRIHLGENFNVVADAGNTEPFSQVLTNELKAILESAFERLSPTDVSILRFIQQKGAGISDVAADLGIDRNAATVRIHRARARLAIVIESQYPDLIRSNRVRQEPP